MMVSVRPSRSGVDGILRTYAFRQVHGYPLYLLVGLADADSLTEWRSDAWFLVGLTALFVLATLAASLQVYRGWKRRERDHAALLRQDESYTARLEISKREAEAARRPEVVRLRTHPGVGPITGLAFVLTLGDPTRFQCGKQVASYLGLIPAEASSGGRQRLGHITKQGNVLLRGLLVEAAHSAVAGDAELG